MPLLPGCAAEGAACPWSGHAACRGQEEEESGQGWVLVDIGGGRGDLAVNLARLLPNLRVHMMDVHKPSLQAAQATACEHGPDVASRMSFLEQDVTQLFNSTSLFPGPSSLGVSDGQEEKKVILVGLHVCGGLTDAILGEGLAARLQLASRAPSPSPFTCCVPPMP